MDVQNKVYVLFSCTQTDGVHTIEAEEVKVQ